MLLTEAFLTAALFFSAALAKNFKSFFVVLALSVFKPKILGLVADDLHAVPLIFAAVATAEIKAQTDGDALHKAVADRGFELKV